MDDLVDYLEGAFTSERLEYVAIEDKDADKKFLSESLNNDPVNVGLASLRLLKPRPYGEAAGELSEMVKNELLTVWICLPPSLPEASSSGEATEEGGKKQDKAKPEPNRIGMVILSKAHPGMENSRGTMLGISLAKPYWNRGYGTEAINWALDWAFHFANLNRVALGTAGYNERAIAVYKRIGFVHEGVARQALFFRGKYWDVQNFSILKSEWEALRGIK